MKGILKGTVRVLARAFLIVGVIYSFWIGWLYFQYEQSKQLVYVRDDSKAESLDSVACGKLDVSTGLFADMASMSATIYEQDDGIVDFLQLRGWTRVKSVSIKALGVNRTSDFTGLAIEVWHNASLPKPTAVIIFRGTIDGTSWHANFHNFFKFIPIFSGQYEQVGTYISRIADSLEKLLGEGIPIYTAGHSLGGGLAQHALYNDSRITKAFAFNSSPVTGWRDVPIELRSEAVEGNFVYRIHENGEVLEFFRLIMKGSYVLNPRPNTDPYFKEYRLNSTSGGFVSQHGILHLAQRLNDAARKCSG